MFILLQQQHQQQQQQRRSAENTEAEHDTAFAGWLCCVRGGQTWALWQTACRRAETMQA